MSPRRTLAAVGLFVVCISPFIAFQLLGFFGVDLLRGPIRVILVGGAVIGAALAIAVFLAERRSLLVAYFSLLATGALVVVLAYVALWYFGRSNDRRPLLSFISPAAPSATAQATATADVPAGPQSNATSAPAPAAAPGVGQTCGEAVVSSVGALVIRAAPGLNAPRIGARPAGTVVQLLCDPQVGADGLNWQHVRSGEVEGWMSAQFLKPRAR